MSEIDGPIAQTEAIEAPPLPSLPVRAIQIFVAPIRLFQALRFHPAVWGAVLVSALLAGASNALIPAELWMDMMREQVTQAGGEVPANLETMANFSRIGGAVGALVFFPVIAAILAGLFSLLFLFGLGFEGRFKQVFAVVAHASLLVAIVGLALTPLRIASGNVQFTANLGALVPFFGDGLFGRFLGLLDVFAIWSVALIGVGIAVVDGKKSPATAGGIAVGAFLLVMLVLASFGVGGMPG